MTTPTNMRPSIGRLMVGRASGLVGSGRYKVFASLGRGGMADVQLGTVQGPKGFNKLVVVKRLRAHFADDPAMVNMFLDEARLDARLNHRNVIHTYEFGEENGSYFIVMEFLEGRPLGEIFEAVGASARLVTPGIWAKIVSEALAGLHHAHELRDYDGTPLNVVHRDVSPQNIVVGYDGCVKLVDFGIAKATVNASKTESQVIKGKLAYMAPEQADPPEGIALDRRADVFAMGIVLWECLAQRRLVTGDARAAVTKILDMEFSPPSLRNPLVAPELDAITRRALEQNPRDRYPTALAMREDIERFLRAHGDVVDDAVIGGLVTDLFASEREALQQQIRAQMTSLSSGDLTVDESVPSQRVPKKDERPAATTSPGATISESAGSLRAVRTHRSMTPKRRSSRGQTIAAIAATLFLGGTLFAVVRRPATFTAPNPVAGSAGSAPATSGVPASRPEAARVLAPSASVSGSAPDAGDPAAATLKPPPPRVTSPPARIAPPKLDDDPWR